MGPAPGQLREEDSHGVLYDATMDQEELTRGLEQANAAIESFKVNLLS